MGSANPRTYTAEEKDKAIARAAELGPAQASAELGIPKGTLSFWKFDAKRRASGAPTPSPAEAPPTPAVTTSAPTTRRARVAKVYTPSQIAQALERVTAIGVRPAAKELGISRNALRDWERKATRAAKGEGPAPTSGPDPQTVEARRDKAILDE